MSSLALCMIVRNEARMLPDCLRSVHGAVDEVVVVDTGSNDDTVAIATAFGAKVVHFPWIDDFAAARNAALPHVTSDWILMLDADERLLPAYHVRLREAIAAQEVLGYTLPLFNAKDLHAPLDRVPQPGGYAGEAVMLLRLTRRTPDFAWDGSIHEGPHQWAGRHVARLRPLTVPIVHLGAVASVRRDRDKAHRNISLLEKRCAAEPDSPTPLTYLSSEYRAVGRRAEADACAERAWQVLIRVMSGPPPYPSSVEPTTLWVTCLLEHLQMGEALQALDRAEQWHVAHPNYEYLRGIAHEAVAERSGDPKERTHHFAQALHAFHRLLAFEGRLLHTAKIPDITGATGLHRLNQCLLLAGSPAQAAEGFNDALRAHPGHELLQLGFTEALIRCGNTEAALRALQPVLATNKPDAWVLAAMAMEEASHYQDLAQFAAQARARAAIGFLNPRYALVLTHLEDAVPLYLPTPRAVGTDGRAARWTRASGVDGSRTSRRPPRAANAHSESAPPRAR